ARSIIARGNPCGVCARQRRFRGTVFVIRSCSTSLTVSETGIAATAPTPRRALAITPSMVSRVTNGRAASWTSTTVACGGSAPSRRARSPMPSMPTRSRPGRLTRERADRNTRRNPWRTASPRRRSTPATGRISPPRPTSPRNTASAGSGRSCTLETSAATTARSVESSKSRTGHLEHADLVHGAEAVLHGAQDAVIQRALALEVEDRVHDVLERLGARDAAALGYVPDEQHRGPRLLREAHQPGRALPHLTHVAR